MNTITENHKATVKEIADLLLLAHGSEGQPYDFICTIGAARSRLDILIKKIENEQRKPKAA